MSTPNHNQPPGWPLRLLRFFVRESYLEEIEGDMEEVFQENLDLYSARKARKLYLWDTLKLMRPAIVKHINIHFSYIPVAMFNHYVKTAARNLAKNKVYFFLNVFGLAIGITCAMLLFFYVQDELSYDGFHTKKNRIYRIAESFKNGETYTTTALTPYKIAPLIALNHPGVETFTRVDASINRLQVEYGEKKFLENHFTFVDSSFFEVFDFELLTGDPLSSLAEPNTVFIGDDKARKYFDDPDPTTAIGKVLTFRSEYNGNSFDTKVAGIFRQMPHNSHFHKDFLISMKTGDIEIPRRMDSWGWTSQYSYIVLNAQTDVTAVETSLNELKKEHAPTWFDDWAYFSLQPLTDIHLKSDLKDEIEAQGDIAYVRMFSIIALFILIIACFNYMNLATARSTDRAREVGLRKVVGASKVQLTIQFLGESLMIAFAAFVISFVVFEITLPFFEQISGKDLGLHLYNSPKLLFGTLGLTLLIGLISGLYPAFVISKFKPIQALRDQFFKTRLGSGQSLLMRKGLVVLQLALSIMLIIGTAVIYHQWEFLRNKKLGANIDQVVRIPIRNQQMLDDYPIFKEKLLQVPGVNQVSASNKRFEAVFTSFNTFRFKGEKYTFPNIAIDYDFFKTHEIPLVEGRTFSPEFGTDTAALVVNESAVEQLGLGEKALGTTLNYGSEDEPELYTIIAVIKDFHYESLHKPINPCVFFLSESWLSEIVIQVNTQELDQTISGMSNTWDTFNFDHAFSYQFLNERVMQLYNNEAHFFKVFSIFSLLAVFIACLGLFGLTSYTTQQRTKEIGIRKVIGASVLDVIYLLNKELGKLLLVAFVIAIPLAYYVMHLWLEGFAYRIQIGVGIFLITSLLIVTVTVLTVGYQSIKAAQSNPVKALRYE